MFFWQNPIGSRDRYKVTWTFQKIGTVRHYGVYARDNTEGVAWTVATEVAGGHHTWAMGCASDKKEAMRLARQAIREMGER